MIQAVSGHTPVALERAWELIGPVLEASPQDPAADAAVYVDATIGLGGHAALVAERNPRVRIIGLDRDPAAVALAEQRLGGRAEVFQAPFAELAEVLAQAKVRQVDAVLFDLGVSSMQLDNDERGFAYSRDTALDMRMDPSNGPSAAEVLATYSQADLARVLRVYGEERFAGRIAAAIVAARATEPIERSGQLVDLIRTAIPAPARRTGGNPAKRTFQALRVEVNGELEQIKQALPQAIRHLRVGGRIVVMSYQSLEDRLVKHILADHAQSTAPVGLPFEPAGDSPVLKLLTRGAEKADPAELAANPRSRPLRLRAAEKIKEMP